jgi:hypothetical protein
VNPPRPAATDTRVLRWLRGIAAPGSLPGAFLGWVVWSSAFVLLYALLSLGCMFGWDAPRLGPMSLLEAILITTWLAHLIALAALSTWAWRANPIGEDRGTGVHRMLGFATRAGYVSSLVATAWLGFPILMLQACA